MDGAGDGTSWNDPANWRNNHVPASGDDVVLNAPGSPTIVYSSASGVTTIGSLSGADTLSLTGGTLTVTVGGTFAGALSLGGGSLTAEGSGVDLSATGTVTATNGDLSALNGATLALPGLTSFSGYGMAFLADGPGSKLDLSTLASFAGFADTITDTNHATVLLNAGATSLWASRSSSTGPSRPPSARSPRWTTAA